MNRFSELAFELRHAAAAPLIPGEVGRWSRAVGPKLAAFADAWPERRRRQKALLDQTARDDPALGQRVEAMRDRQRELGETLTTLAAAVSLLRRADGELHGSWEPRERARAVREELLALSGAAPVLDTEIATWFAESQYRDRGVAD